MARRSPGTPGGELRACALRGDLDRHRQGAARRLREAVLDPPRDEPLVVLDRHPFLPPSARSSGCWRAPAYRNAGAGARGVAAHPYTCARDSGSLAIPMIEPLVRRGL